MRNPLEPEHKKFMELVLSLSINASFLKSMAKLTKFSKDVITSRKELEKASIIVLNELCFTAMIEGLPTKMGDPSRLTLPCEFDNSTIINALAYLGESVNLMPYIFYKNIGLPKLKIIRMTIYMANNSITHPRGIVQDLLVKVGKFFFFVDIVAFNKKKI